jgi:hypothetical protein
LLAGRIYSQRLDRSKPLWEVWLVQGLEDNRFALINKTHHAMVDGVSGVDLATVLFDISPVPEDRGEPEEEWSPAPEPTQAELIAEGVKGAIRAPADIASSLLKAASDPAGTARAARDAAERPDWPAPPGAVGAHLARRFQGDQERRRRDGQ